MVDEERLISAIHEALKEGKDLREELARLECPKAQEQRAIDQVMADYVTELNRALATATPTPYGVDASTFMKQYGQLWEAKLAL